MQTSQHPCWLISLLALLIPSVAANVATFNISGIANLTRSNATRVPVVTVVAFELRTSHPAGAVWGLFGLSANNASDSALLMKIGLTVQHLTVEWSANNSRQVNVTLTDGNWHSVSVRLYANTSSATISVDRTEMLPRDIVPSSVFNWTFMTFGGVNGSDGLRGCLANASTTEIFENVTSNATVDVALSSAVNATSCLEDPCLCANGGTCLPRRQWNLHSGCNCTGTGFGGELCLVGRDFCNAGGSGGDPCFGQGSCINIPKSETFTCNCSAGYLASNCSTPPATTPTSTTISTPTPAQAPTQTPTATPTAAQSATPAPQSDTRLVVGLVVGLLLLLLAGTGASLAFKLVRDRRKDTGVYKPYDREVGGVKAGQRSAQDILRPPNEERLI